MPRVRSLAIAALVASSLTLVPRGAVVRSIRALDQGGGFATRRGERAYARTAWLFRALHERAIDDAAGFLGDGEAAVIDLGSGPGDILAGLRGRVPRADLLGVEPAAEMRAAAAARGVRSIAGRAEAIPMPDGSVDLVLSTLSMHHWADPAAAVGEIDRVLRPGGQARLYDVRFAAYSLAEVRRFGAAAGVPDGAIGHAVLGERLLGFHADSLLTIHKLSQESAP